MGHIKVRTVLPVSPHGFLQLHIKSLTPTHLLKNHLLSVFGPQTETLSGESSDGINVRADDALLTSRE